LSGVAVTAGQFVPVASIDTLTCTPAANGNGSPYMTFTFKVEDDGGTAYGGANHDPEPNTITVNVRSVNDATAGKDKAVTTLEDTDYPFAAADFGFSDPQDSGSAAGANALAAVEITTLPLSGTLKNNGVAVTTGQFVSAADIGAGKLKFSPAANANGSSY